MGVPGKGFVSIQKASQYREGVGQVGELVEHVQHEHADGVGRKHAHFSARDGTAAVSRAFVKAPVLF